jgi:uncharacterized membrane protein YdfJ with MMPL/SSD domain
MSFSHLHSPPRGLARVTQAAATAAARRPRTVIALWLALVVACTALGSITGTRQLSGSASDVGRSAQANAILHRAGLQSPATEQILVRSGEGRRSAAVAAELTSRARRLDQVAGARAPGDLSADGGRSRLVLVTLRGDPDDADAHVDPVLALVARTRNANPRVSLQETGEGSFGHAIDQVVATGLRRAELISIPITLLILVFAFGALVAASVPLLLGVTSVAAAMGALGVVSRLVPEGTSTAPVVILIGLAVGVDYSLFAVRRLRAERRAGADAQAALRAMSATVGRAILVAGATVVIGLVGLLFSGFAVFTSMALGAIVVVVIAVLGSLTVLPAALALLEDRIDSGRLHRPRRATPQRVGPARTPAWDRVAATVTTHPRTALALALALLLALSSGVLAMRTATDGDNALPARTPAVVAADAVSRAFPGASDADTLVVTGRELGSATSRHQLRALGAAGRELADGRGPVGVTISRDGSTAAVSIPVSGGDLAETDRNVERLRAVLGPLTAQRLSGARAELTGNDAENLDFTKQLATVTPLVVGFVLALAFVLLVAAFGSPWLALSVMALNLLSVGAAFGVLVAVFQHTWAQSLLHFTSTGAIVNWLPLFAFVVLFGLSMDYTVLVLERATEARRAGATAREAAAEALARTGSTVSSAALVMIAVFSVFATLGLIDFKQMGVGLAAAIALDATVVRCVALPATLTLLGERGLPGAPGRRPRVRRRLPEAQRPRAPQGDGWDDGAYAAVMETHHER